MGRLGWCCGHRRCGGGHVQQPGIISWWVCHEDCTLHTRVLPLPRGPITRALLEMPCSMSCASCPCKLSQTACNDGRSCMAAACGLRTRPSCRYTVVQGSSRCMDLGSLLGTLSTPDVPHDSVDCPQSCMTVPPDSSWCICCQIS